MSRHNRRGLATGTIAALNRPKAMARGGADKTWYRFGQPTNKKADAPSDTEVWIYDEIGMWGISASDFARDLAQVDTDQITVRLNSPGGEVYDGIAILNALIGHPAAVTVKVDGLAASIASVIAMAGDKVIMGSHSEMMIHEASTFAMGNAADIREVADMLDRVSDNISQVYAERAGGKPGDWRALMLAETWLSADEAVAAGLADEVAAKPKERDPDKVDDPAEEDPAEEDAGSADARYSRAFDKRALLETFTYAGRSAAPAPALAQIQGPEAAEAARQAATQSPEPTPEPDPVSAEPPDLGIPDGVDLASLFADSLRQAAAPNAGIDPEVFHEAVALITDADVVATKRAVAVPPALVGQAFPADQVPDRVAQDDTPDLFRAAVQMAVYDAPDVPVAKKSEPEVVADDYAVIDPTEFYNSLREAINK